MRWCQSKSPVLLLLRRGLRWFGYRYCLQCPQVSPGFTWTPLNQQCGHFRAPLIRVPGLAVILRVKSTCFVPAALSALAGISSCWFFNLIDLVTGLVLRLLVIFSSSIFRVLICPYLLVLRGELPFSVFRELLSALQNTWLLTCAFSFYHSVLVPVNSFCPLWLSFSRPMSEARHEFVCAWELLGLSSAILSQVDDLISIP